MVINNKTIGLMYRPIAEIFTDFKKPIPTQIISKKPVFKRENGKLKKVAEVDFVHWYDLVDELDRISPGWGWEIRTQFLPDRCVIEGRLTIKASEGEFTREATGVESLNSDGYGDPVYSAESSALRRAMAKFGYGLDLWRKDKPSSSQPTERRSNSKPLVKKPIKNTEDLSNTPVTQKQLKLLCAIAGERELSIDTDVRAIVSKFGYNSKKDIRKKDLDGIIAALKEAGKFVTHAQLSEFQKWRESQGIPRNSVMKIISGCGYDSPKYIPRNQLEGLKETILENAKGKSNVLEQDVKLLS